jgi:hypothetical protein
MPRGHPGASSKSAPPATTARSFFRAGVLHEEPEVQHDRRADQDLLDQDELLTGLVDERENGEGIVRCGGA